MQLVKTGLVVEDDQPLAAMLASFLRERAGVVHVAATCAEGRRRLRAGCVDAALIDLALPDGSGLDLLELLWQQPSLPHVIVISGSATPDAAFKMAQAGVRQFLSKPVALDSLERAWSETVSRAPDVRPLLRASVGRVRLRDMECVVRESMTDEALARAERSRRGASSLLGISRQLLQHILRARAQD